jgi:hypothetical protein
MQRISLPFVILIAFLLGCEHHHPAMNTSHCPDAKPLSPMGWSLGEGTYFAQQVKNALVVQASGTNPDTNYEVRLALQTPQTYPPRFALYRRQSPVAGAQSLVEFTTCVKFRLTPSQNIKQVTIHDAKGDHIIEVELPLDAKK